MQTNPHLNQHFCLRNRDNIKPWEKKIHTDKLKSKKRMITEFSFKWFFFENHPVQQCWVYCFWDDTCFIPDCLCMLWPIQTSLAAQWEVRAEASPVRSSAFSYIAVLCSKTCSQVARCATGKTSVWQRGASCFFWAVFNLTKRKKLVIPNL